MIEIRKNSAPRNKRREYLLYIDGVFMENAFPHIYHDRLEITSKDYETSQRIAAHSFTEFPLEVGNIFLWYYPEGIEHLDKRAGTSISHAVGWKKEISEPPNNFVLVLDFGGASLIEWTSPYKFAEYAYEMYRILGARDDVELTLVGTHHNVLNRGTNYEEEAGEASINDIDIAQIDWKSVYALEAIFKYSSPDVAIVDEVARIAEIINEAHRQIVKLLSPQSNTNLIEIRRTVGSKAARVLVNGSLLEATEASVSGEHFEGGPYWFIHIEDAEELYKFGGCRFTDIPEKVVEVIIDFGTEPIFGWELIKVGVEGRIGTPTGHTYLRDMRPSVPFPESFLIKFSFSLNIDNWKGEHSPQEYLEEIDRAFPDKSNAHLSYRYEEYDYAITFRIASPEHRIVDEVLRCREHFRRALDGVAKKLASDVRPHSITEPFNFPEEVAVPCEQYLLYFVRFLRDLGVEATSDLKHEAGQVLFTVTPRSEEEALDKIRTALHVYLRLPASPVSNDMSNEIAIQRLESQVLRVQSDLKLAAAELQAKNATIEAQRITINVQKSLLNGEILLDSMKDVTPKEKEEDKVEFLGGSVALSVYKDKGVELNWAKMFNHLRALFRKKDK